MCIGCGWPATAVTGRSFRNSHLAGPKYSAVKCTPATANICGTLRTPLTLARSNGILENPSVNSVPFRNGQAIKDRSDRKQNFAEDVELLAFRPLQSLYGDWTLENSHVTSQNAIVGHEHYAKIEKTPNRISSRLAGSIPAGRPCGPFSEGVPGRLGGVDLHQVQADPRHGWVPTGWQSESRVVDEQRMRKSTDEVVVTECKINEDCSLGTFQIKFPAGRHCSRHRLANAITSCGVTVRSERSTTMSREP